LRVSLPENSWAYKLSKNNPTVIITIANRLDLGDGKALAELLIQASEPTPWDDELRGCKDVVSIAKIGPTAQIAHFRIIEMHPAYAAILRQLELMWLLPIIIMDGVAIWKVMGTEVNIRLLTEELQRQSVPIVIEDIQSKTAEAVVDLMRIKDESIKSLLVPALDDMIPNDAPNFEPQMFESSGTQVPTSGKDEVVLGGRSDKLAICRLRVVVPENHWLFDLSRKHPDVVFDIMGNLDLGSGERYSDVRVRSVQPIDWIDEFRAIKGMLLVEHIGTRGGTADLRVKVMKNALFALMDDLNIVWRLPCSVKNGVFPMMVSGSEGNIHKLLKAAKARSMSVVVEAVHHAENGAVELLTTRQAAVFSLAMAAGYFDVPRRITLTDLAAKIGVAGSSLSEILAIVEKKLATQFQGANPL
jgi:hypothetical protein